MTRFASLRKTFATWKQSRKNQSPRKLHGQDHRARLRGIELLENRYVLTTYAVTTISDDADDLNGVIDGEVSLREAIIASNTNAAFGDAAAGDGAGQDTIKFGNALANMTIVMQQGEFPIMDGLFINGQNRNITIDANLNSRIFNETTADNVRLRNLTLTSGRAKNGGAISASGGGNLRLDALTVTNSAATGNGVGAGGGGLLNFDNVVRIAQSTFTGNDATGTQGSGGGIQSRGGSVEVIDTDISEGTANRAGGGVDVTAGAFFITVGSTVNDNTAGGAAANPGNGGGISVSGNSIVDLRVKDSQVDGNTASEEGGGIWNRAGSTLRLFRSDVTNNTASGDSADQGGGGIFNNGGELRIGEADIDFNAADGVAGSGGGIFSTAGAVTVKTGSEITNNTATRAGGGVEVIDGNFRIFDSLLEGNTAGPDVFGDIINPANPGNGGGLHVSGNSGTLVDIRNSTVARNTAAEEGGGLWNQVGSTLIVTDSLIEENTALAADAGAQGSQGGGGIFNNGGTVTLTDTDVLSNNVEFNSGSGGGILTLGGTLTVNGGQISDNGASRAGGGIEVDARQSGAINSNASVTLNDVLLEGNRATFEDFGPGNGGGLHVSAPEDGNTATVIVNRGSFVDNFAFQEGGGLWNDAAGTLTLNDTHLESNNADANDNANFDQGGGGVFNNGGVVEINGGALINNDAKINLGSGGNVLTVGGTLTITGAELAFGDAARAGGGIEVRSGTGANLVTLNDTIVRNNNADINGGGLHVTAGAEGPAVTVNVNGGSFLDNVAAQEGGGLWSDANGTLTITGTIIRGNTAFSSDNVNNDQGGGGVFNNGGTLNIDSATISGNFATDADVGPGGNGGGVLSLGGTLNITDTNLIDNQSGRAGGGVEFRAGTGANLATLTDVNLSNNSTGVNGGGLHISAPTSGSAVTVNVVRGTTSNNTADQEGGGLWSDANSTLTITDTNIIGNAANSDSNPNNDQGGGGVFNNGGTLNLIGGNIINNEAILDFGGAGGSGGGVFSFGGTLMIDGANISNNEASRAGGGIEVRQDNANPTNMVDITDTFVGSNLATINGGGLHITAPTFIIAMMPINITDSTFISNTAEQEGGGIWNDVWGDMTITGGTIANNTANSQNNAGNDQGGGGVFNNGGTLTIDSTNIINNEAIAANVGPGGNGGGVLNFGGTLMITDANISNNESGRAGGGIEIRSSGTTNMVTITDTLVDSNNTGINGGGLHVSGGANAVSVNVNGGTFSNNVAAQEGGGLWNDASGSGLALGSLTIDGTDIIGNTANAANAAADAQGGGGVFNAGGILAIIGGVIAGNRAVGDAGTDDGGGGILNDLRNNMDGSLTISGGTQIIGNFATTGMGNGGGLLNLVGTVTITDATIANNRAARAGGGIENNAGSVTVTTSTLTGNEAGNNGGGVHQSGGATFIATDSTFNNNEAVNEGGGLWNSNNEFAGIALSGSTVHSNRATDGGGLFNDGSDGTIILTNSTVSGNTASNNGGGIDTEGGDLNLDSVTIVNNTASGSGGGLNVDAGANVISQNSIIANNSATTGPDVNGTIDAVFSLIESTSGLTISAGANNITGVDPQLGVLQDNGGPTLTHLPAGGSPVIDAGDTDETEDQRGVPRPGGAADDIGAVELNESLLLLINSEE